jgi:hypothetical protein
MQSAGAVFHQACARLRKTGSGTRTKRQPSGSKANASEDALIWHRVIPGHREAVNPESITTAAAMLRGSAYW